jgi:hypothetical protein
MGCASETSATPNNNDEIQKLLAISDVALITDEKSSLNQLLGASRYDIELIISDHFTSLKGFERVYYTNQEETSLGEVYFNLYSYLAGGSTTINEIIVDNQGADFEYSVGNRAIRVLLNENLNPGKEIVMEIDFNVQIPTVREGHYGLLGYFEEVLLLDGFYPVIPVYDGDGWHLPPEFTVGDIAFHDISFYTVKISAPRDLEIITSGTEVMVSENGNIQTTEYVTGPARDFYIIASHRFSKATESIGETSISSYVLDNQIDKSFEVLNITLDALEIFNIYFGAYPYTEFNIVCIPLNESILGVEYPGVIIINQNTFDQRIMLESTVVHEIGHQWFYNMVGNDQVNEPWLDEAIVQYITGIYYLDSYDETAWGEFRDSWINRWDRVNGENIPIGLPSANYTSREYGAIIYGRGPLFIDAISNELGQQLLLQCLQSYYETYKWKIATTESFRASIEHTSGTDLTHLFNEWVYVTHPQ